MSLFKTRDYWSTKAGDNEEYDLGCLAVGDVDNKQDGGWHFDYKWFGYATDSQNINL